MKELVGVPWGLGTVHLVTIFRPASSSHSVVRQSWASWKIGIQGDENYCAIKSPSPRGQRLEAYPTRGISGSLLCLRVGMGEKKDGRVKKKKWSDARCGKDSLLQHAKANPAVKKE